MIGLPSTLTVIQGNAFACCTGIESLEGLPQTLSSIGIAAFMGCTGITSLEGLTQTTLISIGESAFRDCKGITSLHGLPSSLTSIGWHAFSDCSGLTSIGHGINPDCSIHYKAFEGVTHKYIKNNLAKAASANHHYSVGEYGKAAWRRSITSNLRWAVLQSVQTARRLLDDVETCTPHELNPLLRRLATVPSGYGHENNCAEDQVLRHIVAFVGGMNMNCWTLLLDACRNGHLEVAKKQVEKDADIISKANDIGETPLIIACNDGHLEVAKMLVKKGADKDKATGGDTPLSIVCYHGYTFKGHLEIAKMLVEEGADKNKADNNGKTPLFIACQNDHLEFAKLLVDKGADIDKAMNDGRTPLFIACDSRRDAELEFAKMLLENGSDKDKADNDGRTPIFAACQ
jgi:hypothetical protein